MNSSKANPSTAQPQRNYSLLAIPAVYTLAFPPHLFEFAVAMRASNYSYTNILPRTNVDSSFLKDKMSKGAWESIVKARGAHMNALEGFPLFAGAMIAGNYAKLPAKDLNFAAAEYIGARIVYTTLYMMTKSEAWSYMRTGVWFATLVPPLWILWKAGVKVRDEGIEKKEL